MANKGLLTSISSLSSLSSPTPLRRPPHSSHRASTTGHCRCDLGRLNGFVQVSTLRSPLTFDPPPPPSLTFPSLPRRRHLQQQTSPRRPSPPPSPSPHPHPLIPHHHHHHPTTFRFPSTNHHPTIHPSTHPPIHPSTHPPIHPSTHPPIHHPPAARHSHSVHLIPQTSYPSTNRAIHLFYLCGQIEN